MTFDWDAMTVAASEPGESPAWTIERRTSRRSPTGERYLVAMAGQTRMREAVSLADARRLVETMRGEQ